MTPPFQPTVTLDRAVFNACYALCEMAGTVLPDIEKESLAQIQKRGCDAIQVLEAAGIPSSGSVTAQINAAIATLAASLATVAFTGSYSDLLNKPTLGVGTVTSVQLSVPSLLNVTSPPVTGAGIIQAVLNTQLANRVLAGPTSGAPAIPDFRKIIAPDITLTTNKVLLGVANIATESTPSTVLDVIGSTRGSLLYRGAAAWSALTPGPAGYSLVSGGAGADPFYSATPALTLATDKIFIGVGNVATAVTTNVYNIVAYGATTGSADNHAEIMAAYNAAVAAGGGTVYVPKGTYITAELAISSSVGITFLFADRYSSILKAKVNTAPVLTITGSNVTIKGGGFDGAYVSGASSGASGIIYLSNAQNIAIDGCLIQNGLRNGVVIWGACQNIKITGSRLYRNYCSVRSFEDVPNNTTCINVTVNKCELVSNWDHTGNDQTGGIKMQTSGGVTVKSSGHNLSYNYIYNVGLLPIEFWTGENGTISDSVVHGNRIFGIDSGDQWGISLNGCLDVEASNNTVRLTNAFVGIEIANQCQRCLVTGNTINLFAANGTTKSTGVGIGLYNNYGYAPKYSKITNNTITGATTGIHTQNTTTPTDISDNTIRDCSDVLLILNNSSYITAAHNIFGGACSSQVAIFGVDTDITDIEIAYCIFNGDVSFRNVWGYNNSTAHTFTNFHFHHNDGTAATFSGTGIDSWALLWDAAELIKVRREDNYTFAGSGKADWPDWFSSDWPTGGPFTPAIQEFSIPIAAKFTFTVAASATDQWYKIFHIDYGNPLTMALHVHCDFTATSDNNASAQTFWIAGSPYGQAAGVMKMPDGNYNGGVLKGIIYDNAGGGSYQDIWIRFGPTSGGTVTVGGADWPAQWILVPSVVTSAPTYNANHYELVCNTDPSALKSRYIQTDQLNIAASGYANFGTTRDTSGYGFRDNAGTMEVKNSGGAWAAFGSGAVTSIAGTANEITASAATGAVTLSLPTAMTFTGKTVTGGTFDSPTLTTPALGTPASGVVTNLTGTASININGTVGATTPNTVKATTLDATGQTDIARTSGNATVGGTANPVGARLAVNGSAGNTAIYGASSGSGAPAMYMTNGVAIAFLSYNDGADDYSFYAFSRSHFGGITDISDTTASTSTTTGSLVNAGGFGNAGNAHIGGDVIIGGALKLGNAYAAGVVISTGSVTVKDSAGTTYRLLCAV